jgi:CHAT domain-containing protein
MQPAAAQYLDAFQTDGKTEHLDAAIQELTLAETRGTLSVEDRELLARARWVRYRVLGSLDDLQDCALRLKQLIDPARRTATPNLLLRYANTLVALYEAVGDFKALDAAGELYRQVIGQIGTNAFEPQVIGLAYGFLLRYERSGSLNDLLEAFGLTLPMQYTRTDPGSLAQFVHSRCLHALYRMFGSVHRLDVASTRLSKVTATAAPLNFHAGHAEAQLDWYRQFPARPALHTLQSQIASVIQPYPLTVPDAAACAMALGFSYYLEAHRAVSVEYQYEGAPILRTGLDATAQTSVDWLRKATGAMDPAAPLRPRCLARLADALTLHSRWTRSTEERTEAVEAAREALACLLPSSPNLPAVHHALARALWWRNRDRDRQEALDHYEAASKSAGDFQASLSAALDWLAIDPVRAVPSVDQRLEALYTRLRGDARFDLRLLEKTVTYVGDGGVIGGREKKIEWYRPVWMSQSFGWGSKAACGWAAVGRFQDAILAVERERLIVLDCGRTGRFHPPTWSELLEAAKERPLLYLLAEEEAGYALILDASQPQPASGFALPGLTTAAVDRWMFGNASVDESIEGLTYHSGSFPSTSDPSASGLVAAYAFWQMEGYGGADHDTLWLKPLEECGAWLGETVLAPLERHITSKQLTIMARGLLALLPLQATFLPDASKPTGRRYLLDSFEVRFLPSARVLMRPSFAGGMPANFLGVADPQAPNARPLPYAAAEVGIAGSTFAQKKILSGAEAAGLPVATALERAEAIHLCCHAYANFKRPSESAIALADGDLITLWNLVGIDFSRAHLVILAACESGKITRTLADQMFSLGAGLLGAGARAVISTAWEINDPASSILMLRFYHNWRVRQLTAASALREAQAWTRDTTNEEKTALCESLLPNSGGTPVFDVDAVSQLYQLLALEDPETRSYSHPHFWAGFVYAG